MISDRELLESMVEQNRELKKRLKASSRVSWSLVLGYIIIIIYTVTLIAIR